MKHLGTLSLHHYLYAKCRKGWTGVILRIPVVCLQWHNTHTKFHKKKPIYLFMH